MSKKLYPGSKVEKRKIDNTIAAQESRREQMELLLQGGMDEETASSYLKDKMERVERDPYAMRQIRRSHRDDPSGEHSR